MFSIKRRPFYFYFLEVETFNYNITGPSWPWSFGS